MRRCVALNCLVDANSHSVRGDAVQNLRQAVLSPATLRLNIQQALRTANFKFHRACSYSSLIQECDVCEGQTLLMFWGHARSDSRATLTMSASSCSSLPPPSTPSQREREVRSMAQQTDISCRHSPTSIATIAAGVLPDEDQLLRARLAGSLSASSPASSLLRPPARSVSILSSVCAMLLSKQPSLSPKAACSVPGSPRSDIICRICFGGESAERLVRPCSCRGTIAAVHRSCLERWLLQAATSYCELCRHHYVVTRSHKWSWILCVCSWAVSGGGRALAGDAWRGAALCAASVLGTARALHACDRVLQAGAVRGGGAAIAANLFSSLLIGIIGALNGLLTTWLLLKVQEHQASWQAWRASTLHVHVALADQPSDVTVVAGGEGQEGPDAPTADRSTNVADPFMVSLPYTLPEP